MPWSPHPDEELYYALTAPQDSLTLQSQLLHSLPNGDPTWGRDSLPRSPAEDKVRKEYGVKDGKATIGKNEWVAYQVWEPKQGVESKNADIVWCHGINDYGGKFAIHAPFFLDAGYRLIVPDLPAHGRSTGLHCYIPDMEKLAEAVYQVLVDVLVAEGEANVDAEEGAAATVKPKRKIFVAGQSLGGFTAVLTCLKFGSPSSSALPPSSPHRDTSHPHPVITGGIFLCPMLEIAPNSRPSYAVEFAARGMAAVAGALPFAQAIKGKVSEDEEVEEQFLADPQTYHGKLRIATGLAVLKAITSIAPLLPSLSLPFLLCHGTGDRVISHSGSEKLLSVAASEDKELKLYEGYEHVLLRKGREGVEGDDERRARVLKDMGEWLVRH